VRSLGKAIDNFAWAFEELFVGNLEKGLEST
jgi:hypothetical protein